MPGESVDAGARFLTGAVARPACGLKFRVGDNPGAVRRLSFLTPVVNLLPHLESGRQSCLEFDLFSGDRVVESQKLGVQEISSRSEERRVGKQCR